MNKRAVLDDFADVAYTVVVVLMVLFVFNIYTESEAVKIKRTVDEKDATINRESVLLTYLRTPISQFATANNPQALFEQRKQLLQFTLDNKMTVADLIIFSDGDRNYLELLRDLTRTEQDFTRLPITVKFSNDEEQVINAGTLCIGKVSSAQLPIQNNKPVVVRLQVCT